MSTEKAEFNLSRTPNLEAATKFESKFEGTLEMDHSRNIVGAVITNDSSEITERAKKEASEVNKAIKGEAAKPTVQEPSASDREESSLPSSGEGV